MGGRAPAPGTAALAERPRTSKPTAVKSESASAAKPATKERVLPEKKAADSAEKPVAKKSAPDETPENEKVEAKPNDDAKESTGVAESTDKLVFFSRKTGKKQVALTYDDGPNPAFTPRLAEWLRANNVPATFFVCGNMVKEYPDHVKKLAADGFELANHSYNHPDLRKLSPEKITEQLQDTHDLVKEATGVDMNLMRPPYGAHNSKVDDVCRKLGYKIINWDVDTEDWRKRSTPTMMKTIMSKTGDGSIILMHDRKHGGQDTVLETTKQAVQQLRAKGYTFVSVGELLEMPAQSTASASQSLPATGSAAPEVSSLPVPLVNNSGAVTTTTLPTPAIMTPAPILP
jgi:peptidoglycan/xylan/chitin deacetylase (PgdA/CDA1 family)